MQYQFNAIDILAAREGRTTAAIVLEALNTAPTINQAAEKLGVSYRTLYRCIRELRVESTTTYYIPEQSEQGVA